MGYQIMCEAVIGHNRPILPDRGIGRNSKPVGAGTFKIVALVVLDTEKVELPFPQILGRKENISIGDSSCIHGVIIDTRFTHIFIGHLPYIVNGADDCTALRGRNLQHDGADFRGIHERQQVNGIGVGC